jgi:glycolate oxidase FAD binding subunit
MTAPPDRNPMNEPRVTIDGFGPLPLARPASVAELGDLVRHAAGAIYPLGGQTHIGLGRSPTQAGVAVDLRGLDQVVDFPARDMTVTVQAGITLGKLQQMLAPENLRLPIDVPRSTEATLGGVVAANVSGARRFGYGTLRDYVIGISAVNDEGAEFKAGGRVVKNVAGYDLCKLLVGSLGTLGIITQVTLKLRPLAEEQAIVCLPCRMDQVGALLDTMAASRTRPVILDVVNRAGGEALFAPGATPCGADAEATVLVGYEGNVDAVNWQVQHLVKELGASFPMEARIGFTGKPLDQAMTEWPAWPEAKLTLKASVAASAAADFLRRAESLGAAPRLRAHAGNGIVFGHYRDLSWEAARELVRAWRAAAAAVVVIRSPPEWKPALDVWGPPPADLDAMRQVKARFDPRGILNPGRFLDGLQ